MTPRDGLSVFLRLTHRLTISPAEWGQYREWFDGLPDKTAAQIVARVVEVDSPERRRNKRLAFYEWPLKDAIAAYRRAIGPQG